MKKRLVVHKKSAFIVTFRYDSPQDIPTELVHRYVSNAIAKYHKYMEGLPGGDYFDNIIISGTYTYQLNDLELAAISDLRNTDWTDMWQAVMAIKKIQSLVDLKDGRGIEGTLYRRTVCWGMRYRNEFGRQIESSLPPESNIFVNIGGHWIKTTIMVDNRGYYYSSTEGIVFYEGMPVRYE